MFYENGWFQFTADIPLTPISWQKSPFRYIIVEIVAQLVYSFFQESSFNEDCRNERFCNAINAKVRVDGIAWWILFWMVCI